MKSANNGLVLNGIRLVIKYLSYQPWMLTVLTSVFFLIVGWINFSNGNLNSLGIFFPILKWLGFEESGTYRNKEILAAVAKVFFVFGMAGIMFEYVWKKVFKFELRIKKGLGFILITMFFLFAFLSCFSGLAKEGAVTIIPILVFFWILAMVSYFCYHFLEYFIQVIDRRLDGGS